MTKPVVAIFAGSLLPTHPQEIQTIAAYATQLGKEGYDIVYGGGINGVMGLIAKAAQDAGSNIRAIILDKYKHEPQLDNIVSYNVKTELERFALMHSQEHIVACVMFPGGPGTLREASQALEAAVYEGDVPLIIPDIGLVNKQFLTMFQVSVAQGYVSYKQTDACRSWSRSQSFTETLHPELTTSLGL